jgi:hypothetical protein
MGWTYFEPLAHQKTAKGEPKRKEILDNEMNDSRWEVVKSSMVGSTYYAAIRLKAEDRPNMVIAVVCLTSVQTSYGKKQFGYKDMTENEGPNARQCPASILDLLTPTESEYALGWREDCRKYAESKRVSNKDAKAWKNIPLGAKIIWTAPHEIRWGASKTAVKGDKLVFQKSMHGRSKQAAWVSWTYMVRLPASQVKPEDFEFVTE